MEEFFLSFSNKKFTFPKIFSEGLILVKEEDLISGNLEDLYKYKFPVENCFDFSSFEGNQKINLFNYKYPHQTTKQKGIVIIFHGLNAHINAGSFVADYLSKEGYTSYGFDQRGFGKSEGRRGFISDFNLLYEDSKNFFHLVKSLHKDDPVFVLGMSMGAQISYRLSFEFKSLIQGNIMMSPALKPIQKDFFVSMGILMGTILNTPKTVKPKIELAVKSEFCKNKVQNDPLAYNEGTRFGTLKSLLKSMKDLDKTFSEYDQPFIAFVGEKDKIIDISASYELLNKCQSKIKVLYHYEELYHDIWNEIEIFDIMPKVISWLEKRL